MKKEELRKELNSLFKSMDFVSNKFLNNKEISKKEFQIFFNIYQQLGLVWEFLGLQCRHREGYKKTEDEKEACKICGKIKGIDDHYYLLPKDGLKKLGMKLRPNSKKIFKGKKEAAIVNDAIDFYGARVDIDVHNSYKSRLFGEYPEINIAAERIVKLKESGIECHINRHLIHIKINRVGKRLGKEKYGGFPWEITRRNLKKFPVIFEFDESHQFLGLTILK